MATFPLKEAEIFELAYKLSDGLKNNSDIFPAPPINPLDLDEALTAYAAKREAASAAQAVAEQATSDKQAALRGLVDKMKKDFRYAEMAADFDDDKLKTLGWGGRREPTPLAAPGQAVRLVSREQGSDWITLAWERPGDGGKPSNYEVLFRALGATEYQTAATTLDTEITLANQERGKELEYAVAAVNRAGRGPISNAVMAVL
uniref:Fibronectin type III domain-containing protein n=1 Tax=Candidatus Kentrum eta TaxID=2126337 RepID=A0A450VCK6_9GAMM|nr:MAG: Fibronectin type III domain-containing protein [Candidatus Kentron sp. H]VFJ96594.1 MAG: Fibronectin type III domain-containing protein [Candidatus Kentron sp. H]VFK02516.1 MAG: Fibronectin type III domain-containing protein [Candidatus Kentron sp. H]